MRHPVLAAVRSVLATLLLLVPLVAAGQGRPAVAGLEAAVTSDHPLATAAGADVLRRGGNAVDAAVTMAAVLTVVRPQMNGVGGDAFVLFHDARTRETRALNGSGRAGSRATPQFFQSNNRETVPGSGIMSVSVPGAVAAWGELLSRHGTITLAQALAPAIHYAERGFPMSARLAADFEAERRKVLADAEMARIYMPGGEIPAPGTLLVQADLGRTLRLIAEQGVEVLYSGELGQRIADFITESGGTISRADMAAHRSTWQTPITTEFRGQTVLGFPPSTQGVTMLQALAVADRFDMKAMGNLGSDYMHTVAQISALVYAERDSLVADSDFASVPVDRMLSRAHTDALATRVRATPRAMVPDPDGAGDRDDRGDTVYLSVVDREGNAISWIQSLFAAFGSGLVVPGTGITLHNRGALFSMDAGHPNIVAPGKRPFHTLTPAMVLNRDGSLMMVLGSPGGDGQPQTILQVLNNVLVFGMSPQEAIESPRWRHYGSGRIAVEPGIADSVRAEMTARGHNVVVRQPGAEFGGAQMILLHPSGARITGADFRREAYGIAW